jgi:TrmH family RNA methyltransferase
MAGLSQRRAALVARLRVAKTRSTERAVLVEGVRAVTEALDAGIDVRFAVSSPRLETTEEGRALARRLAALDLTRMDDEDLPDVSDTEHSQGVLLVGSEPEASIGSIRAKGRYLVLDAVQDPGNAGTLVRAAVAFGLDGVLCLEGTVDPWIPKTVRASAGMIFRVPILQASAPEVVERLSAARVPLLVADASGDDPYGRSAEEGFALAVGNEGAGVRPELRRRADAVVAIRMPGPAESLNVAMAASILLHTLTREGARD